MQVILNQEETLFTGKCIIVSNTENLFNIKENLEILICMAMMVREFFMVNKYLNNVGALEMDHLFLNRI